MPIENLLVSIVVITYNSSEFVIETLESAKAQTYQNIELIVSDDCSKDNTVEVCRNWMKENKDRFVRTELITVEKNTGIPANCNRGIRASHGEWVKPIAGDDTMEESYIEVCLSKIKADSNTAACYSNSNIINAKSELIKQENSSKYKDGNIFDDIFFLRFWPKGPSLLFKRQCLFEVGLYDENIWVEDYLMIMKLSYNYKIKHIDEYLVNYRRHNTNSGNNSIKLYDSQLQSINFFKHYSGFEKRKQEIILSRLFFASRNKKGLAIIEIFKNIRYFNHPLYIKSLLNIIIYWPFLKPPIS